MREMCNKNGLTGAERDVAADVKDRVHFIFRTCETETELIAAHRELCDHIDSEQVPKGPTRRRRTMARKEGCTDARRTPAPSDRDSGVGFLAYPLEYVSVAISACAVLDNRTKCVSTLSLFASR